LFGKETKKGFGETEWGGEGNWNQRKKVRVQATKKWKGVRKGKEVWVGVTKKKRKGVQEGNEVWVQTTKKEWRYRTRFTNKRGRLPSSQEGHPGP